MHSLIDIPGKFRNNFSSLDEVWLFTRIFLLATVLPVMLKFIPLPRLMNMLTIRDSRVFKGLSPAGSKDKIVKFTEYILSCNFWIYQNTCLKRSLILYRFLNQIGMKVQICFGVKYSNGRDGNLEGHAWLVFKEKIFLEKDMEMAKGYKTTYCYPERH